MNPGGSQIRKLEAHQTATVRVFLSARFWQRCVRSQHGRGQFPGAFKDLFQEATSEFMTLEELDKVSSEKGAYALPAAE